MPRANVKVRFMMIACGLYMAEIGCKHVQLSDRLLDAALADYFSRQFCSSKFPHLKARIEAAYDSSRLKHIVVPCRSLKCSTKEQTDGMAVLSERARQYSDNEALEVCTSYPESLKEIEEEFDDELRQLVSAKR